MRPIIMNDSTPAKFVLSTLFILSAAFMNAVVQTYDASSTKDKPVDPVADNVTVDTTYQSPEDKEFTEHLGDEKNWVPVQLNAPMSQ